MKNLINLKILFNKKFLKGLELGDIGTKFGFDTTDNGYLRFNKYFYSQNNFTS